MKENRRTQLLLGLLVLVGGYYLWGFLAPEGGGVASFSQGGSGGSRAPVTGRIDELALAALEPREGSEQTSRDLFDYQPEPRPEPKRKNRRERKRNKPKPKPEPAPVVVAEPPKPTPPRVDVVYLGSFGRSDRPIAVFADKDNIYNVFQGGVIKEKFVLQTIGYESVDIGFVGFPDSESRRLPAGGSPG